MRSTGRWVVAVLLYACSSCITVVSQAIAGGVANIASNNSQGDTVTDLVFAVRDEDIKVHINVEESVRVCLLQ